MKKSRSPRFDSHVGWILATQGLSDDDSTDCGYDGGYDGGYDDVLSLTNIKTTI